MQKIQTMKMLDEIYWEGTMSTTKKRKPAALPRRPWYGPDKLRAAFMAGQGASGGEIAKAIGGTTPDRVRAMLRVHGIPLMREKGSEDILFVRWKVADREALEKIAARMEREPGELAALIVRKAIAEKAVEKMIDPLDVVGL